MVHDKYLDPNGYLCEPSEAMRKAFLVRMGVRIHNLLVDIKELLENDNRTSEWNSQAGKGFTQSGTNARVVGRDHPRLKQPIETKPLRITH